MESKAANFLKDQLSNWLEDAKLFGESCLVAISLQIAIFPLLWIIGWALPWPRTPILTTVIEYELDNSQLPFKPKEVYKYRDPKLNQ